MLLTERYKYFIEILSKKNFTVREIKSIKDAYKYAFLKHQNQFRKSGDPYIIHPLEVAIKLAEWGMEKDVIISGLLHDLVEDTNVTFEEIEKKFNRNIANLVSFVTKISKISKNSKKNNKLNQADYTIRLFMSMSVDIRAMVIKLADRLHNLLTIKYLSTIKQKRIAQETIDIYANIAGRLGMYEVKTILLDLSFEIINPKMYRNIQQLIKRFNDENFSLFENFKSSLTTLISDNNIDFRMENRVKAVYSTYKKLKMNNSKDVSTINDLYAVRIITKNELDMYRVLGLIHLNYTYLFKWFKDYVSAPKNNFYQSIHTSILMKDILVEIQIRTEKMDLISKKGIASHFLYKEQNDMDNKLKTDVTDYLQINELKNLKDIDIEKIKKITRSTLVDVLVLNNKKWYNLSSNSTALEVAYLFDEKEIIYLHSIVRNGVNVPFGTLVNNGDIYTFKYSQNKKINHHWLSEVNNNLIRSEIFDLLQKENEIVINDVKKFFNMVKKQLKNKMVSNKEINKRIQLLGIKNKEEFVKTISKINISFEKAIDLFTSESWWKESLRSIRQYRTIWLFASSYFEFVDGVKFSEIVISSCCSKLPYLPVVGVIISQKLFVHFFDCSNVKKSMKKHKTIYLNWNEKMLIERPRKFKARVILNAIWGESIINNIVKTVLRNLGSMHELNVSKQKMKNKCKINLLIYVNDYEHLNKIMDDLVYKNIIQEWIFL